MKSKEGIRVSLVKQNTKGNTLTDDTIFSALFLEIEEVQSFKNSKAKTHKHLDLRIEARFYDSKNFKQRSLLMFTVESIGND